MKKPMKIMLICVGILFGGIFAYKTIMGYMFKRFMASQSQSVTVSAMKVAYADWQPELRASASLRAVQGVNIAAEIAGLVQKIHFTPGAIVKQDDRLVTLDADADIARLHSLEAFSELSKITYNRSKLLYEKGAINKAQLDSDKADLDSKQAQVNEQAALIDKKIIRAPFSGQLGISAINLGQYVNPGDKMVTLQDLNPIYVDFYVPQQTLTQLSTGQQVQVTVDAFPGKVFTGKITTIDPVVDTNTRNVQIEATVENNQNILVPGMFATIRVSTGKPIRYLTLPQTAISYNPYGNIVYIIHNKIATQTFVKTGETRGDQIAILEGLKEGDLVVTSGQLKLKNNTPVIIDNTVAPSNNPSPHPVDE